MTKENIELADKIIFKLLKDMENISFSSDIFERLANTVLRLEQAKFCNNSKVLNWGSMTVHNVTDNGELTMHYTQEENKNADN